MCIKKKGDGNPIASITRETTKSQLNTIFLLKRILPPKQEKSSAEIMSLSFKDIVTIITSGLVVQKWLIRFFITAWESYSNISFSSSSVFFFFFLLLLEVRQFEAERLTWLNFSLIEVRRESSSFCHLTHRNTKMFAPSPSCSAYSMVLLVQVISFEYRCGRQDHGRIQRL